MKKRKVEVDELSLFQSSDKIFDINTVSVENTPEKT